MVKLTANELIAMEGEVRNILSGKCTSPGGSNTTLWLKDCVKYSGNNSGFIRFLKKRFFVQHDHVVRLKEPDSGIYYCNACCTNHRTDRNYERRKNENYIK